MDLKSLIENSVYFLALINPVSKVFLLCSIEPRLKPEELRSTSLRATAIAFTILCVLAVAGHFVLSEIFHVDIYSLKVAGGIVLFIIGLTAVRHGQFYEKDPHGRVSDLSVVPLAAPLIAGPGTITAAIAFAATHGVVLTLSALTLALLVNYLIMLASLWIGAFLERIHATGPLVRIAGLVVAAVAVQMVFSGLGEWLAPLLSANR